MKDNVFVDSNVWLYAMAQSDDALGDIRYANAKAFLLGLPRPRVNSQVIREVCCNLKKKSRTEEATIKTYVLAWYQNCEVVTSNVEQFLLASGCTTLYSEDMQHGRMLLGQLTIVNPGFPLKAGQARHCHSRGEAARCV
ncbi:MAG: twitching motility protein PilT [Rhodoferax sp.]|nr:twitching motility protein PilT [Rhodoferax sp.]